MKRASQAAALCFLVCHAAFAHRLDEYLQNTLISIETDRVDAQIVLTPGVTVFPLLIKGIDTDGNGIISNAEQQSYADRILRDLSFRIDGEPLTPRLKSMQFPAIRDMQEGRGEIVIEISAALPRGGTDRKLVFENHHQPAIAAYQVNCLVPGDPDLRILAQKRNYTQSSYELDFTQTPGKSSLLGRASWSGVQKPLQTVFLLLMFFVALGWRQRSVKL
jgi:hypothetical protein